MIVWADFLNRIFIKKRAIKSISICSCCTSFVDKRKDLFELISTWLSWTAVKKIFFQFFLKNLGLFLGEEKKILFNLLKQADNYVQSHLTSDFMPILDQFKVHERGNQNGNQFRILVP